MNQEISPFFDKENKLVKIPKKQEKKKLVLEYVSTFFEMGKEYNEKQVNEILKTISDEYVILRRTLIDYSFLQRTSNGEKYWLTDNNLK